MRFEEPQFLWALLFLPVIIGLFTAFSLWRRRGLARFAEHALLARLLPQNIFSLRPLKAVLFCTAYVLLTAALARPQFGLKLRTVEKQGIDIMIALDVSRSMLAEDITPNRLRRAKHEITQLLKLLEGDRVGLTLFAGTSFIQMPLTADYDAAAQFVSAVESGWISSQGTDLSGAVEKSARALKMDNADKVILLISDGEEQQGNALKAARQAADSGVSIYTLGVGSADGVPIPLRADGSLSYVKDKKGKTVMTKLNAELLENIARESGGRYFSAGSTMNLQAVYEEIRKLEKGTFGESEEKRYRDQYQIFLTAALICFILYYILPDQITGKRTWRGRLA
ncbi:MAG: vWA domain-containing protein [Fibrobacterota bacterium]